MNGCAGVILALLAVSVQAAELRPGQKVPVLEAMPGCVQARLGRVSAEVGSKDSKRGVGYGQAFGGLADAAAAQGADAVVLRSHEATYITRSRKTDPRPGYIALQGVAVKLGPGADCRLVVVDADEYGERSRNAGKIDITTGNKHF